MVDKRTSEYPRAPLSANTNFSNFVIQNDWPVLQGDWRAEQDPATGKTIYIQNSNNKTLMVNGQKYSGHVNLYGGNMTIKSGAVVDGAELIAATNNPSITINDGGVINIADPVKLDGATLALESGAKANIQTNTGGIISLEGTENKGLVISGSAAQGGTNVASTIQDFDGNDSITLADIQRSDVASVKFVDGSGNPSKDHVTITLNDGSSITLNITDIETTGYSLGENPDGSLTFEVCFLTGTSISTSGSTVCVETIKVGDIVETYDWKTKATVNAAVTWVGHKHMNAKTHLSDDLAGYPVRVLKNAIADNIPNKDLLVTPEHCLFFEGNFVPVSMLVNDRSIYYDRSITSYDYYHIETDTHSVIWANGMLTESYLDTGNRNTFVNAQKVVSLFNDTKSWDNDAAAPLNVHREIVEPIYNQINERALEADCVLQTEPLSLTNNPNLRLETELGTIIQPHASKDGKYIFNIPEGVNMVNLLSRTSRPCDTIGSFVDDRRDLGVLVGGVCVVNSNGIYEITNHLSDQDLPGWDAIEQSACRWTNGKATLNIHSNYSEKRILILNILSCGPYIENSFTSKLSKKAS